MSPLEIFDGADLVVKAVIIGLLVASIVSWAIMFRQVVLIIIERNRTRAISRSIRFVEKVDDLRDAANGGDGRIHEVLCSVATEWKWSIDHASREYEEIRQRLFAVSDMAIDRQYVGLAGGTAWLATIGNTAPFVGLFGTVWGILNSFIAITGQQQVSLAVVAPGMAEALFATAVGLSCAIPASVGYNQIVQGLAGTEREWRAIVARLEVAISRHYSMVR